MFLLVPAYPGCPGQTAVKWLLLLLIFESYSKNKKVDVFWDTGYMLLLIMPAVSIARDLHCCIDLF